MWNEKEIKDIKQTEVKTDELSVSDGGSFLFFITIENFMCTYNMY